jgi:uncharacterized protein YjbJ (UPF0337 family)
MDENRLSGTARNVGGRIEEGFGRATGDSETQIKGKLNQAAGAAQDLYGQTADAARDTAANLNGWFPQHGRNAALHGRDRRIGYRLAVGQDAPAILSRAVADRSVIVSRDSGRRRTSRVLNENRGSH